jgi:hypothetical protein
MRLGQRPIGLEPFKGQPLFDQKRTTGLDEQIFCQRSAGDEGQQRLFMAGPPGKSGLEMATIRSISTAYGRPR